MWPYTYLERMVGANQIKRWYDIEIIDRWKAEGLGDYEADEVAIQLGQMAHDIWPGWTIAGLDADVYP